MKRLNASARVVAVVILGIGVTVSACTTDPNNGQSTATTAPRAPSSLYSVTSRSGTFVPSGESSSYRFAMVAVSPTVVQFSDRPARQASSIATAALVQDWTALFGANPPNAAVILNEPLSTQEDTVVVTLSNPSYDAAAEVLTFDVTLIEDIPDTNGVSFAKAATDRSLPVAFGSTSLFIDNAAAPSPPRSPSSSDGSTPGPPATTPATTTTGSSTPAAGGPACPTTGGSDAAALYATFSGEADKGGPTPITNVWGFTGDGQLIGADTSNAGGVLSGVDALESSLHAKGLLKPKDHLLNELRGMAFGSDGTFYVVVAHKNATMILQFSATTAADGARTPLDAQPWILGPNWKNSNWPSNATGLQHPYGLAVNGTNLYVTVQDTSLGMWFDTTHSGVAVTKPSAEWLSGQATKVPFFMGTFAPAAAYPEDEVPDGQPVPDPVESDSGGITGARGVAYDATRNMILIADSADSAVKGYDAATGRPYGKIWDGKSNNPGSTDPTPVGVVVSNNTLYVGDEANSSVVAVELDAFVPSASPITHSETSSTAQTAVAASVDLGTGAVTIDHTSGLAVDGDGRLYVGNRKGRAINRYTFNGGSVATACVFAGNLTDTPEQLLLVSPG